MSAKPIRTTIHQDTRFSRREETSYVQRELANTNTITNCTDRGIGAVVEHESIARVHEL